MYSYCHRKNFNTPSHLDNWRGGMLLSLDLRPVQAGASLWDHLSRAIVDGGMGELLMLLAGAGRGFGCWEVWMVETKCTTRLQPVASHSRSGSVGRLATVGVDGVRLKAIA